MRSRHPLAVALSASALLLASPAAAHLELTSPPSREGGDVLKNAPCGRTGGERSDNVTVYEPGQTIELVWDEYIDHPGHYRVAFDPDGDDDLADPACLSGCDTATPEIETDTAGVMVLLDDIPDRAVSASNPTYRVEVTLPDVECDDCTLQVIQVMYDKPPYTLPGNEMYYQCADLVLRGDGMSDDGGCSCSSGTAASPMSGGLLLLLPFVRRRRPKA